ncbi:MAG: DNA-binding MltR family transcriptional regulator [Crocinitomicaceae bacterium]|jgi:DNA-binding MltR family transcriptional regulator
MDNKFEDIFKKIVEQYVPIEELPKELYESSLNYWSIRNELIKESDRGCALLAASQLELALENLLRKKLVGTKKHKDSLFSFNGCLGTFSSRIQLSYSLGLISKLDKDDLDLIRKIRNEFGHSHQVIDFDFPKVSSLCKRMNYIRNSNKSNRSNFLTCVSNIIGILIGKSFAEIPFKELKSVSSDEIEQSGLAAEKFAAKLIAENIQKST